MKKIITLFLSILLLFVYITPVSFALSPSNTGITDVFEQIASSNLSNREKLQKYVNPYQYVPKKSFAAVDAYMTLGAEMVSKKGKMLNSNRVITTNDVVVMASYVHTLYELFWAIDQNKSNAVIKQKAQAFVKYYVLMNKLK